MRRHTLQYIYLHNTGFGTIAGRMTRALLLTLVCLGYATRAFPCDPLCVHGTCEASGCSCAEGWAGRQCTQATGTSYCSPMTHNCSGFVTCDTTDKAATCTTATSDYISIGSLGSNFSVAFEYSTTNCNGVLVHAEDGAFPGYYFILELQDGTMRFTASCGMGEVVLQSIPENFSVPNCLCSGQWLSVKVIKTQDISYLEVTKGRTVTVITSIDPSSTCVAGNNVTFSIGTMKEDTNLDMLLDTSPSRQFNGYIRNIEIMNVMRRWTSLNQIQVPGPSSTKSGNKSILPWMCAGLGGAGMLICTCTAVNLILVCVLCYQQRNKKLHSNKKPQRQYPGSRLNLLPVLDIKDSPFQDNIDNPTTITFTPISAVPPQRIPYLHSKTLGYPQQDCNDGMPTCQNSLGVSPSTNSNGQGTEGRGTTYKLNTAGTGSVLLHQCSSDNST